MFSDLDEKKTVRLSFRKINQRKLPKVFSIYRSRKNSHVLLVTSAIQAGILKDEDNDDDGDGDGDGDGDDDDDDGNGNDSMHLFLVSSALCRVLFRCF
ncbi:hypothetical protein M0804_004064 [Polistes exclamans]|nr:hypothetical protein M0804_004064 [Polistes exclamans]